MNMLARNIEIERPGLSDDANRYLDSVRSRGWHSGIRAAFERADQLNILFVGETIIDEYRYVSPLAKPSKEFILATVEAREPEQFLGGVIAASLHGEWKNTTVVTDDGEPIKKTRYVEDGTARKVFEIYNKMHLDMMEPMPRRGAFKRKLCDAVDVADVVIAFDFGHGLLAEDERTILQRGKFFAVNAQTNAGNYGFNPVTKYERAALVCVDMPEARLAIGRQDEQNAVMAAMALATEMDWKPTRFVVTEGRNGASALQWDGQSFHIPAFGSRAIDTMGAGDAFLAVTAPLVAAGLDLEAAAFVGNVAGAIKTDIVGHRRHVGRDELLQAIEGLLA